MSHKSPGVVRDPAACSNMAVFSFRENCEASRLAGLTCKKLHHVSRQPRANVTAVAHTEQGMSRSHCLKQYIHSQQQIMYLQSNVHVKKRSQDEEAPEEALSLIHGQMRPGLVIVQYIASQ